MALSPMPMPSSLGQGPAQGPDSGPPQIPGGAPAGSNPVPGMAAEHDNLAAKYGKASEARDTLDKVREQMDSLVKLGDSITPEDVIKSAGALVGAGLEPNAMASLLADMPEGGEALQAWIKQHDQDVTQREQQLDQVHGAIRHQLGASALRLLMAHSAAGAMQAPGPLSPQGPASAPAGNPLGGQ